MRRKWNRFDVKDVESLREDISVLANERTGDVFYRILTAIDNDITEMRQMIEDLKNKGSDNK